MYHLLFLCYLNFFFSLGIFMMVPWLSRRIFSKFGYLYRQLHVPHAAATESIAEDKPYIHLSNGVITKGKKCLVKCDSQNESQIELDSENSVKKNTKAKKVSSRNISSNYILDRNIASKLSSYSLIRISISVCSRKYCCCHCPSDSPWFTLFRN